MKAKVFEVKKMVFTFKDVKEEDLLKIIKHTGTNGTTTVSLQDNGLYWVSYETEEESETIGKGLTK